MTWTAASTFRVTRASKLRVSVPASFLAHVDTNTRYRRFLQLTLLTSSCDMNWLTVLSVQCDENWKYNVVWKLAPHITPAPQSKSKKSIDYKVILTGISPNSRGFEGLLGQFSIFGDLRGFMGATNPVPSSKFWDTGLNLEEHLA